MVPNEGNHEGYDLRIMRVHHVAQVAAMRAVSHPFDISLHRR